MEKGQLIKFGELSLAVVSGGMFGGSGVWWHWCSLVDLVGTGGRPSLAAALQLQAVQWTGRRGSYRIKRSWRRSRRSRRRRSRRRRRRRRAGRGRVQDRWFSPKY